MKPQIILLSKQNDISIQKISKLLNQYKISNSVNYCLYDMFKYLENKKLNKKYNLYCRNQKINRYNFSENQYIAKIQLNEKFVIEEYILHSLTHNKLFKTINIAPISSLNKLLNIDIARKVGLNTKDTKIISSKSDFEKLPILEYVTKPLDIGVVKFCSTNYYISYTSLIGKKLSANFFPSLVQERIDKEFEVRMLIFGEKVYSIGILSQNDEQTSIDVRNYNKVKPNYTFQIMMPDEVVDKCNKMLSILNLFSGSFDFVKGKDGNYYFLEVNPHGEFDVMDYYYNDKFYEKITQELLIKMEYYER